MNSKQIKTHLETWAIERFEDAESIKVVRNEFGDWNVEVDWDGGYFVEIHSYACKNGKFRSLGVTEVTY